MSLDAAPGTSGWLRARNDRAALELLLAHGPLTRTRLGELSGLSKPTAAQMVARLETAGLIAPVGEVSGGRGPNAVSYGVRAERVLGVAVDVGEHVIRAAVVDALDHDHPVAELPVGGGPRTPVGDVRAAMAAASAAAGVETPAIAFLAVGVQAAVADGGDRLSLTDTLPGWPATGARAALEAEFGIRVTIDNDVNLAALGERAVGAAREAGTFSLVWMGDGLGLATDLGGDVHRGSSGSAGEIGYLPAPRTASALDPGAADLTDLVGGPAIASLLARFGSDGPRTLEAILAGASGAPARRELAQRIALGIAPLLAVLDPELVVLGGPTGAAGGSALAAAVTEQLARTSRWTPRVAASALASDPVLRGARTQLVRRIRDRLGDDIRTLTP